MNDTHRLFFDQDANNIIYFLQFIWISFFSGYSWFYDCWLRFVLVFILSPADPTIYESIAIAIVISLSFSLSFIPFKWLEIVFIYASCYSDSVSFGVRVGIFQCRIYYAFVSLVRSVPTLIQFDWHWYKVWWLTPFDCDIASGQWNGIEKPIFW